MDQVHANDGTLFRHLNHILNARTLVRLIENQSLAFTAIHELGNRSSLKQWQPLEVDLQSLTIATS